jgi:hypothetical protein
MNVLRVFILPSVEEISDEYFEDERFERDLEKLARGIERAHEHGMKVVVVGGRVPGRQHLWTQDGRADRRLWQDAVWHEKFAAFWQRIARRLGGQPAVVGYDILNEPRPERMAEPDDWTAAALKAEYGEAAGTARDLNVLYARAIRAIREVDRETPIILSAGLWGSPTAMCGLAPIHDDDKILYTFHWYAPGRYTVWREHKGKWEYPGEIPEDNFALEQAPMVKWDIDMHRQRLAEPVRRWQEANGVASNRILLGEFSADRRLTGADQWNRDVIQVAEENGWHWTYYAFRERGWDSRDFELGTKREAPAERTLTPLMQTFVEAMKRAPKR